ncbi:vomeronasal type-1 receptor 4-like [Lepus europaeus]|uniref:vomeronasal type-1 receptor 4-like n=1 Tax=Lepus europaeus TaxID=9983 RepID=UPI002B47AFB1|nr:vomeronasal type-1 receptor 4-like [Lepus europaeus]
MSIPESSWSSSVTIHDISLIWNMAISRSDVFERTYWLCVNYCPSDCMTSRALTMEIIFVSQIGVGVLGNILLLLCYGFISCTGRGIKRMDLILHNLIVANCLVLLSRGIPQTMAVLGLKYFMGDFACKLVFYVHRVARGVSLSATSLLSGFQAITISLSSPQWMELKVKALKSVRFSILLCWPLQLLVNSMVPMNITAMGESNNLTEKIDLGFCSGIIIDRSISLLHSMMFSFIDVLHLVLMIWASGCMVFILYRHKQKVLHMHSKSLTPKCSPETTATHSILMLFEFIKLLHAWVTVKRAWFGMDTSYGDVESFDLTHMNKNKIQFLTFPLEKSL